jgi:hypothetical protein
MSRKNIDYVIVKEHYEGFMRFLHDLAEIIKDTISNTNNRINSKKTIFCLPRCLLCREILPGLCLEPHAAGEL